MRSWGLALGAALSGLLAGYLIWGSGSGIVAAPASPARPDQQAAQLPTSGAAASPAGADGSPVQASLRDEGSQLVQLRDELARELARGVALEAEVEELRRQLAAAPEPRGGAEPGALAAARGSPEPDAEVVDDEVRPHAGGVDERILLAGGFDPGEVAEVRAHLDEIELERLFIRDQASREGWRDEPRFWQENVRLGRQQAELRDEYGDDGYDWILYAMGRDNRVVADDVLPGSAAEEIGLEPGDVIVAYDGQRILAPHELQRAVLERDAGTQVALDVERAGTPVRFHLSVGPIGIRLGTARHAPRGTR